MLINDASITGSLIVNASASFQNILVGGNIIPDTTNLRNLGSTDKFFKEIYVSTGSINFVDNGSVVAVLSAGTINAIQSNTSSANDRLDTIQNTTSSLNTFTASISTTNTFTASILATNTFTSSATSRLNAIETITSSNVARLSSIETISASNISRLNALETTSASIDTLNTTQNTRLTNLEIKTGSLATTGSNTFIGTQIITGSLYVTTDLIVQGSSSLQNITASAVNIGTNKVILNTNNPAVRFGGISVIDSGSTGLTGSILWDSTNNNWLYQNPSGSSYTSAKFISGPQSSTLGGETGLNTGYIPKAVGDDHIGDSIIFESGSRIGLGTTQPNAMIHTTGSIWITDNPGTNSLIFGSNGSGTAKYAYITSTSEGAQKVGLAMYTTSNAGTSNQERLRITDSGYIGVGTTAPANKLEVFDTQTTIPQFQIKETSSAYHRFGILKSGSFVYFVEPGNDGTSASEYLMTINMNGNNVGIGTSSPEYPLDLYGVSSGTTSTLLRLKNGYNDPSTGLRVRWDFASIAGAYLDVTTDSSGHKSMTLYLSSANATPSQVLTIAGSNGNLSSNGSVFAASDLYTANALRFNGSGLNASDKKLYSPTDGELQWMTHSSAGAHAFSVSHQGTRYVYLDVSGNSYLNGGNVGIGITNPSNKLQVSGNIYSTDTVFGKNLKPEAFAGPAAGTPTSATIPPGYSSMTISSLCDNQWRPLMNNIGDVKAYFWVTLGDAASKDTANYFISMTSPAYGVSNFGNVSYQDNGWNTGGFEFTTDTSAGMYRLLVRCTSYYNSANTAYGTIYFLRME